MSTQLDLDDAVAPHPLAAQQLAELRTALRQVAQSHAWLAFGECRRFGSDLPFLTSSDADAVARAALERGCAVAPPFERGVGRLQPERDDVGMLKAAADKLGLQYYWHHGCGDALHLTAPDATAIYWTPLRSDADALALAVRMEMDVFVRAGRWTEAVRPMGPACNEPHNGDPLAATRRAIVRAAFEVAPHALPDDAWRAKPHQPLPGRREPPNVLHKRDP